MQPSPRDTYNPVLASIYHRIRARLDLSLRAAEATLPSLIRTARTYGLTIYPNLAANRTVRGLSFELIGGNRPEFPHPTPARHLGPPKTYDWMSLQIALRDHRAPIAPDFAEYEDLAREAERLREERYLAWSARIDAAIAGGRLRDQHRTLIDLNLASAELYALTAHGTLQPRCLDADLEALRAPDDRTGHHSGRFYPPCPTLPAAALEAITDRVWLDPEDAAYRAGLTLPAFHTAARARNIQPHRDETTNRPKFSLAAALTLRASSPPAAPPPWPPAPSSLDLAEIREVLLAAAALCLDPDPDDFRRFLTRFGWTLQLRLGPDRHLTGIGPLTIAHWNVSAKHLPEGAVPLYLEIDRIFTARRAAASTSHPAVPLTPHEALDACAAYRLHTPSHDRDTAP